MKGGLRTAAGFALASFLAVAPASFAQGVAYPKQSVKVLVPYAPGGLPDTVARVVGQKLSDKWGQAVVVENKPGGNGVVSAQALMASPPDGYTLLVTDMSMFVINPFIYSKLPYDPQKDFTAISLVARAPLFLAVHPSMPVKNFQEFVALAKAQPGTLSYGSSGIGSIHHLTFESIKAALGIDVLHVPFKGTGQSVPAVVSNQVSCVFSAFPSLAGFTKEGKLRLIAVNSKERSSLAPDIATIAETNIPGFDFAPIIGVWGPAGMPAGIADKIAADVGEVLRDPAMKERLHVLGIDAVGLGPAAFTQQLAADRVRYEQAVKVAQAKAD
jgi:tripartite-type tricarboxylate transporter receptor subunit TctC